MYIRQNLIITAFSISVLCSQANASWLIDARKFHASVHGQISCQDCHGGVQDEDLHPDPEDIGKGGPACFRSDHCVACHGGVLESLKEGLHGTLEVQDPKAYGSCLECHDPHYQAAIGEEAGRFDPLKPLHEQCGACHEPRSELPPFSPEDKTCMKCHRSTEPGGSEAAGKMATVCFHCHANQGRPAQQLTARDVPLINPDEYDSSPHAGVSCIICHPQATSTNHGMQNLGPCRQCHLRHDEKVAHDLHALVSCEACHLRQIQPVRDVESKRILWERKAEVGQVSRIHDMISVYNSAECQRCHRAGNKVGAVAMVLPAKSILCMPCHAATFSVGDTTTLVALGIWVVGMALIVSYVFSGSLAGQYTGGFWARLAKVMLHALRTLFSSKVLLIIKALFLDVLLQRRLYRQSARRWFIHSLIFYPFVFRFVWGLVGLLGSLWKPDWSWIWSMLDKDHPLTAFLFDLTGIMIMFGLVFAFVRGRLNRVGEAPGQPKQDLVALALIAGIVVVGFILEGMRLAMTGYPRGSVYAFLGYAISQLFKNTSGVTVAYGYFWYVHAILTGGFIAYLPFSRLAHIIIAPFVVAVNAAMAHDKTDGNKESADGESREIKQSSERHSTEQGDDR
jgi:nitrate reductase gamma subunit